MDPDGDVGVLQRGDGMMRSEADPPYRQCDGLRSDGAQCLDELGHYGGHVWPEVKRPIVVVGDMMRFSVELLRQIDQEPDHCSVLVRLRDVRYEVDGSKTLVVEKVYE